MEKKILYMLKSIGLIFLILLFPSIFFIILNVDVANISDTKYIFYLTIANLTLMGIFIYIYRKTLVRDFKNYIKNFSNNLELGIKYWLIGFIIMAMSNLFITYVLNKGIAGNEQDVRNYLEAFPLFMVFNTVIYAPLTEELAFRKSIREAINNKWMYVLVSGLVFGMLHISSYMTSWTDLIYLIPYSSLGIAFALLYYKTDNIFSSMTMHAIHNFLAVAVYLLGALI